MPKVAEYTLEFKDRAVRLVVAERGPDESRSAACERLAVKPVTLYGWVKRPSDKSPRTRTAVCFNIAVVDATGAVECWYALVRAVRRVGWLWDRALEMLHNPHWYSVVLCASNH